jgi:hypothetical protein
LLPHFGGDRTGVSAQGGARRDGRVEAGLVDAQIASTGGVYMPASRALALRRKAEGTT